MANLRELSNNYKQLQVLLDNLVANDDRESEEYKLQEQAILDTMDSIEPILEEKVDNYCWIISDIDGDIAKLDKEIKRLQARKKTMQNNIDWLKGNLLFSMKQQDKKKIKTPYHNCTVAKAGMRKLTPKVDAENMPEEYKKVEYKIDLKALRDYFKANEIEENEYAKLEEATESLRIS